MEGFSVFCSIFLLPFFSRNLDFWYMGGINHCLFWTILFFIF